MYVIGHAYLTEQVRGVDLEYSTGQGARALMLPDFADSHAFAYTHAWEPRSTDADSRLIRSHIAGDWWIHFGDEVVAPARRRGWAYLRMGVVARQYETFFRQAFELGLRDDATPNDSRRGWAHSMLEYSVDTYLCQRGRMDAHFDSLRRELGNLAGHHGEVRAMFEQQQVDRWSRRTWHHAMDYSLRVALAETPEDIAVIGALGKFDLDYSPEAREFLRGYQRQVVAAVGADEYEDILRHMARFVYDVDRGDTRPAIPGPPAKTVRTDGARVG